MPGLGYLWRGFRIMWAPGVKRYVFIPLLINILLFGGAGWLLFDRFEVYMGSLMDWLPDWLDWLAWVFRVVFGLLLALAVFYTFTLLATLIAAPFNSLLSEKVQLLKTGQKPTLEETFSQGVIRAFRSEFIKMGYQLTRLIGLALLCLVLMFIPPLNLGITVIWFVFGAWMLNLEYLDYPLSNNGFTFAECRQFAQQRRWTSLGFGTGLSLLILVPIVNLFIMPAAVAGVTLLWLDHSKLPHSETSTQKND